MTTHEILVDARNLIDRDGWVHRRSDTGSWEGDDDGSCASNALLQARTRHGAYGFDAWYVLADAIGVQRCPMAIIDWNDAPGRTKDEVLDVFARAIAATAPEPYVELERPVEVVA